MRVHRAGRGGRAEGALTRLLLVVVLALGVFLMHAVGHPEGSGGSGTGGPGTELPSGLVAGTATGPVAGTATGSGVTTDSGSATGSVAGTGIGPVAGTGIGPVAGTGYKGGGGVVGAPGGAHHGDGSGARHEPGSGTDMTTLCVAVLAGCLLSGLVRAALGGRSDRLALLLARLVRALGPHAPPPRPPDLTRLSVLRI